MTKEKRNRPTTGDSPLKMGSLWIQAYRLNPSKPSSQESRGFNHGSVKGEHYLHLAREWGWNDTEVRDAMYVETKQRGWCRE